MRQLRPLLAAVAVLAAAVIAPVGVGAQPDPTALDRVFPEPLARATFIQFTADPLTGASEYLDGIAELETRYPESVDVTPIGDLVGIPGAASAGGRAIPVIEVTDQSLPDEGKVDLYFSMSIHGLERAGLEGATRFMEDLAIAFHAEQAGEVPTLLQGGDPARDSYAEMTVGEALRRARLVFVNLNPDGWAAGDLTNPGGGGFKRGNDTAYSDPLPGPLCCVDLNRQWPTLGWHNDSGEQYETGSQPEAVAGRALIEEYLGVPEGAADLHGELDDDVLLAIMFPAGQFHPLQLARQEALAAAIKFNVNTSVFPGASGTLSDLGAPLQPAEFHTAYDAIGYDDSGFHGDYLVQQGILEMDHEYFFSNLAPGNVFVPALEQIHVDTTRELLEATIVTTIVAEEIGYTAELGGDVGYVFNPEVLTQDGATVPPPFGFAQEPYASTSMQYWEDLAGSATRDLRPVSAAALVDDPNAALAGLATVVVTDRAVPTAVAGNPLATAPDRQGAAEVDRDRFWSALQQFAAAGGNVVLTDAALQALVDLGLAVEGEVTRFGDEAGRLVDYDRQHELLDGVGGVVGQTYFEVPLGFPFGGTDAPVWQVDPGAWERAGGDVAASSNDGGVSLGSAPLGDGRVTVFGAVLPDATQAFAHTFGLADYAVTYAANAILVNALDWATVPFPAQAPDPGTPEVPAVVEVVRLGGAGRNETAAAVSADAFEPGVDVAYVATARAFPDALAGGAAAAAQGGPVLLTEPDALPPAAVAELQRLQPGRIVVLGGPAAVSERVAGELARYTGGGVARVAGADRFETAAAVSAATFPAGIDVAFVATGEAFPDALAGGAAAGRDGGPVLLVGRDALPEATRAELARLAPNRIVVLGGDAAVSPAVVAQLEEIAPVDRVAGATRYETAAAVASSFAVTDSVTVATGADFPDALAGVPAAVAAGAPVLLAEPAALPEATAAQLRRLSPDRVTVLGGQSAVAEAVIDAIRAALA